MSRLTRDETAKPVSRDQILRRERGQENIHLPVELTTSRIGNLTWLILTLAMCDDHTYIPYMGGANARNLHSGGGIGCLAAALLRFARVCVRAMNTFCFIGSLRVSAFYLSSLAFAFLLLFFPPFIFVVLTLFFCFYALVGPL